MPHALRQRISRPARFGLLLLCLLLPYQSQAATLEGRVSDVPDANRCILMTEDGRRHAIALMGLTLPTPESPRWRSIARRHLHMLLAGRHVRVERTTRNKQGVILGEVHHGGADVGLRMLRAGLAVTDPAAPLPTALRQRYLQAQQEARRRGMGYWQSVH